MGVMSYRLLVVAVVAACSDTTSGIEVIPGTIDVAEGEEVVAQLRFDGKAAGAFRFHMDEQASEHLVVALGEDGHSLHVTPRCSAIADGGSRRSEEITISMTDHDTPSIVVPVNIEPSSTGSCAVQIVGWAGPCDAKPMEPPIAIRLGEPYQAVCLEVRVPDSLSTVTVAFPAPIDVDPLHLLSAEPPPPEAHLPLPDAPLPIVVAPDTAVKQLVWVAGVPNFRGHMDFALRWAEEVGDASGVAHLEFVVGQPGEGALRVRGTPSNVNEYRTAKFLFSNTYYDVPDSGSCVRATPLNPDVSSLAIADLPHVIPQDTLVCGEALHTIELLTGIDSAGIEGVKIELLQCNGCGDNPDAACCATLEPLPVLDTTTETLASLSVAERISSGSIDARACVDIDGNDIPELLVGDGTNAQLLVGAGTPGNIRYSSPAFSFPLPLSMFALEWRDETTVHPVLVGEFATAPFLRAATTSGWEAKQWAVLPTSPYGTDEWVPLAPQHGAGASYLIVQKAPSVLGFACVSAGCTDGPTIDVSGIGGGSLPGQIRGIGVADTNGDTFLDLLVAVDSQIPMGGDRDVFLYAYQLRWSGHQLEGVQGPTHYMTAATHIGWQSLKFVSVEIASDEDRVFVLARGGNQHALVEVEPCGNGCRGSQLVGTIGTPYDMANVSDTLYVATDLGIWKLDGDTWAQRDPERALGQSTFPVPDDELTYGRTFRSCLMNPMSRPSFLFDVEDGARWSFADVVVETLPAY